MKCTKITSISALSEHRLLANTPCRPVYMSLNIPLSESPRSKWFKVTPNWHPKWSQSNSKWPSSSKSDTNVIPNWSQNDPNMIPNSIQSESQMTPRPGLGGSDKRRRRMWLFLKSLLSLIVFWQGSCIMCCSKVSCSAPKSYVQFQSLLWSSKVFCSVPKSSVSFRSKVLCFR